MAEKLFYSMGEVAEMFDVRASLIRHWESQFSVLRPKRNKKGNRLFSPEDVENLKVIYHLVKERGMTLEGAKKSLRRQSPDKGGDEVTRDAELMERLQRIRAMLVEVREDLKVDPNDILPDSGEDASLSGVAEADAMLGGVGEVETSESSEKSEVRTPRRAKAAKPVVKIIDEQAEPDADDASKPASARKPRRKKEDSETKELFAFYEQSLF